MIFISQVVIKHLEQERDLARRNVECLEEERDALRERLKVQKYNLLEVSKLYRIKFLHILWLSSHVLSRVLETGSVPRLGTIIL
jgi:hypothetical protein